MSQIVTHYGVNYNWVAYKGGHNPFTISFTLASAAYDISGLTFVLNIRKFGDTTNALQLTQGSGLTNDGAAGTLDVVLTQTQAGTTLPGDLYFFELIYTLSGNTYSAIQGNLTLAKGTNPGTTTSTLTIPVSLAGTTVSAEVTLAGGGGASSFEDITGSPSDNSALQAALDAKAPTDSPTFTGTPVFTTSPSLADNVRWIFNPGANHSGLNVGQVSSDPAGFGTLVNGDLWYNSSTHKFQLRVNSATVSVITTGDGVITAAGNGLTESPSGTVVIGGSVTGSVNFNPSLDNTYNFVVGENSGEQLANFNVYAGRVNLVIDPNNLNSAGYLFTITQQNTNPAVRIYKNSTMGVSLEATSGWLTNADGSLNHYIKIDSSAELLTTNVKNVSGVNVTRIEQSPTNIIFKVNGNTVGILDDDGFSGQALLSGTPTAPTATAGTSTTQIATTAFVKAAVAGLQDTPVMAPAMWPRTTNGCAALAKTEIATSLFNIQSLDFDQTTQEFAQFQIVLPRNWNNGTITAVFYWTAASGSGTVEWGISGGAYSDDDALTVAFGTAQTVTDTLIATNDLHKTSATAAITLAGSPADADFLAIQISRNPANDTLSADAKLLGVVITLTTDSGVSA